MDVQESLRKARERALRAKTEVNGSEKSGPKVTYEPYFVFILLVSP